MLSSKTFLYVVTIFAGPIFVLSGITKFQLLIVHVLLLEFIINNKYHKRNEGNNNILLNKVITGLYKSCDKHFKRNS